MRPSATTTEPIGTSPSSAAARACARASVMNVSSSDLKDHLRRKLAGPAGFEPAAFGFVVRRSIQLSYGPFSNAPRLRRSARRGRSPLLLRHWRRGRDSNPRYSFGPYTGLANQRLQPLGHLSQRLIDHMLRPAASACRRQSPLPPCTPAEAPTERRLLDRRARAVKATWPQACIGSRMPLPIEDYAIVADCRSAALVGKDGSIDWLCLPRMDSDACFAALLGTPEHGRWLLAPEGGVRRVTRRYRDCTLILATEVEPEDGGATVG